MKIEKSDITELEETKRDSLRKRFLYNFFDMLSFFVFIL
jgi:hypothetical protein